MKLSRVFINVAAAAKPSYIPILHNLFFRAEEDWAQPQIQHQIQLRSLF
jgi:hypothetical protein